MAQISERAGVSLGTFYQYFRGRSDVMAALVDDHVAAVLERASAQWQVDRGEDALREMLTDYVTAYADQASFNQAWEEVCQTEPELAELRRRFTRVLEHAVETTLRRAVDHGHLPPIEQPAATARALCALADRFCYLTYAFDPDDPPMNTADAGRLLTEIWGRVIRLPGPLTGR